MLGVVGETEAGGQQKRDVETDQTPVTHEPMLGRTFILECLAVRLWHTRRQCKYVLYTFPRLKIANKSPATRSAI